MRTMIQAEYPARSRYSGSQHSPTALIAAAGVHVIAVTAILLMPGETIKQWVEHPFITYAVPAEKKKAPPPPAQPEKTRQDVTKADSSHPTLPDPFITLPQGDSTPLFPPDGDSGNAGSQLDERTTPPVAPVQIVSARPDPRYLASFQPDYPAAMIREGVEGKVTVRVHITPQGRVDAVDLIEATRPAFWNATRAQALAHWRFLPGTRDGVAVASERVMTVRFAFDQGG